MMRVVPVVFFLCVLAPQGLSGQGSPTVAARPEPVYPLHFVLETHGIEPANLTVREGTYLLDLEIATRDQSLKAVQVLVADDNARAAVNKTLRNIDGRSRQLVTLQPGRYVISLPGQPKWQAVIMVRPRAAQ